MRDVNSQEKPVEDGLEGDVVAAIDEKLALLCGIELMELRAEIERESDLCIERCRGERWFDVVKTFLGDEDLVGILNVRASKALRSRALGVLDLYQ